MKKRYIVSLGLAALLCLSACATTPEAPVVVQKNNDRLIEKATSEYEVRKPLQEAQEEAPKDYSFKYTSSDGKVTITAEADVVLPDTDRIPMYQVSCKGFPQELITAIYDYLFQGESTWYAQDNQYYTKAMADEDMEDISRQLERLEADTELDPDRKENQMKVLQEDLTYIQDSYESYPDEIPKVPADGTYKIQSFGFLSETKECPYLDARTDSGKSLSVYSFGDYYAGSNLNYSSETGYKYSTDPTQADINSPLPYGSNVPFSCAYSYEDAKALADGIFQAAGVDVRLVHTELVRGAWNQAGRYENWSLAQDDAYNAYRFCYSRVIDGIPVATTTSNSLYLEDTNPTWLYERIYVTVDSGGISNVHWSFPVTQEDVVNENVQILSFAEASRIFEEMAPLIYQGKNAGLEEESGQSKQNAVLVNKVELNLMRTRDGGELTGLYVPAWVFYGTEEYGTNLLSEEHFTSQSPWIILAVNAVDGSIIDVKAGY